MPITPPVLDDRAYDDLVAELLARIPSHAPEWTNPAAGDPGRTLLELFAWLTDTLLYRANRIPERQRLAFLRLLGSGLRPARAARGMVTLGLEPDRAPAAVELRAGARLAGPPPFETRAEITVLPVQAEAYIKRRPGEREQRSLREVLPGLQALYELPRTPAAYVTTPVFGGGAPDPRGLDLAGATVDRCLWIGLFAARAGDVAAVKDVLGGVDGRQRLLNVGIVPAVEVPALLEEIGERARIPHVWEITTGREDRQRAELLTLDVAADSADSLRERGVVRLVLPGRDNIGAPTNDVLQQLRAGVGVRPPRLDDPERAARLVAWIRLRPTVRLETLPLSWIGVNAVEIDQRRTLEGLIVGQSDGSADQEFQVAPEAGSVEPETLRLEVEEAGGYREWLRVDDVALAGRDAQAYTLDAEAGTVRFGDGVRGRVPATGARIRVARVRVGGGPAGNLPAGTLKEITPAEGGTLAGVKVAQPLPTTGGEAAETAEAAERRIPALFRHRNRAVTEQDYRTLAMDTPGVRVGRVEVLPRFKPHQRHEGVPGVVSVMVLPYREERQPPNPRPDRPFIQAIYDWVGARRPLGTELYVIGCEYVPLGVGIGVEVRDGSTRDTVLNAVRDAVRRFLWPLPPGGAQGTGWPLGASVVDRELEVVVAQVPGVRAVRPIRLFRPDVDRWERLRPATPEGLVEIPLRPWQLPELLAMVTVAGAEPPDDLTAPVTPRDEAAETELAVPVVPEVC